jgi:NAD(P)-dependent dehydrogenase (short-subunit alcohol dehydrogenase family)
LNLFCFFDLMGRQETMKRFKNKKVFITGGSSGIGKAAAILAARHGASVFIAARN